LGLFYSKRFLNAKNAKSAKKESSKFGILGVLAVRLKLIVR